MSVKIISKDIYATSIIKKLHSGVLMYEFPGTLHIQLVLYDAVNRNKVSIR
jgi:hypothetical protein